MSGYEICVINDSVSKNDERIDPIKFATGEAYDIIKSRYDSFHEERRLTGKVPQIWSIVGYGVEMFDRFAVDKPLQSMSLVGKLSMKQLDVCLKYMACLEMARNLTSWRDDERRRGENPKLYYWK
jgi:hypothetical protein